MAAVDSNTPATATIDTTPAPAAVGSADPFASQRDTSDNPFSATDGTKGEAGDVQDSSISPPNSPNSKQRRTSKEWDASKVPPSQFQKRKGSIYATPSSRDAHTSGERDKAYFDKLKEKGWSVFGKKK